MLEESAECLDQVDDVVAEPNALDQHVIDVHLHVLVDLVLEDLVNEPLVGFHFIL